MPSSVVYRIVARECMCLFKAANGWTAQQRLLHRRLLAGIYDQVSTALMQDTLASGEFTSVVEGSTMSAYVDFQAYQLTISILDVTFDGGDGHREDVPYEKTRVFMVSDIHRDGSIWRLEHIKGEPMRLPGPVNTADAMDPHPIVRAYWPVMRRSRSIDCSNSDEEARDIAALQWLGYRFRSQNSSHHDMVGETQSVSRNKRDIEPSIRLLNIDMSRAIVELRCYITSDDM